MAVATGHALHSAWIVRTSQFYPRIAPDSLKQAGSTIWTAWYFAPAVIVVTIGGTVGRKLNSAWTSCRLVLHSDSLLYPRIDPAANIALGSPVWNVWFFGAYQFAQSGGVYSYIGGATTFSGRTDYVLPLATGFYDYIGGGSSADYTVQNAGGVYASRGGTLFGTGAGPGFGGVTLPSSVPVKWTPFEFACRLRCLQQGSLNIGNTQQNRVNLMNLALAQIAVPSTPPWAKKGINGKVFLWVPAVPGYRAPPGAPYAR